jgi:pimeloyl-ACP methyl ester carboxylesterase
LSIAVCISARRPPSIVAAQSAERATARPRLRTASWRSRAVSSSEGIEAASSRSRLAGSAAAVDKKYLDRPVVRAVLVESLSEAFRSGSRGPAGEMGLYARPWGFRLEDIRAPVHLWHGEQDANAPATMGRYMATVIPKCQARFYPGEGHLHFVDRLPEILAAVGP